MGVTVLTHGGKAHYTCVVMVLRLVFCIITIKNSSSAVISCMIFVICLCIIHSILGGVEWCKVRHVLYFFFFLFCYLRLCQLQLLINIIVIIIITTFIQLSSLITIAGCLGFEHVMRCVLQGGEKLSLFGMCVIKGFI